ncbi:hypothetical protein [Kitasatospora sp. NPDC005856]|uniref:hypothetical protein n=1 Tax=Kitasatospora sp. NPDC005856 TaxID=3154566 RepID=UPI0033F36050
MQEPKQIAPADPADTQPATQPPAPTSNPGNQNNGGSGTVDKGPYPTRITPTSEATPQKP